METSAVSILTNAWRAGRPVVIFIGAGLSAPSGFPLINEQRDYLCKVWYFLRHGVFRVRLGDHFAVPHLTVSPQIHPSTYLAEFGWPDYNQLDADLWTFFDEACREDVRDGDPEFIRRKLLLMQPHTLTPPHSYSWTPFQKRWVDTPVQTNTWWIDRCFDFPKKDLFPQSTSLDGAYWHDMIQQDAAEPSHWGRSRARMLTCVTFAALRSIAAVDETTAKALRNEIWKLKLTPRIDWSKFLLDLSEGNTARIDRLFIQLNERRLPALGHILLAHLAKLSFSRLVLSINFDTLLESAFRHEGLNPTVFEVSNDSDVPDPELVRRDLSIVKLHGGSFGLRLGEQIEHALDERTRSRVLRYFPPDSLLLVLGFSGMERRMLQLLRQAVLEAPLTADSPKRLVWMFFEQHLPEPVRTMQNELVELGYEKLLCFQNLADIGSFLLDLYQHYTGTIPRSKQPFQCLRTRLRLTGSSNILQDSSTTLDHAFIATQKANRTVTVFHRQNTSQLSTYAAPSVWLSRYVQELELVDKYRIVWIDLEEHHTVGGVVSEILHRLRSFDPGISPFLAPYDPDPTAMRPAQPNGITVPSFAPAVQAIHLALRRGHYLLAFDSFESFARPETVHHGVPAFIPASRMATGSPAQAHEIAIQPKRRQNAIRRVVELVEFLKALIGHRPSQDAYPNMEHFDWKCALSIDVVMPRHIRDDCRETSAHVCNDISDIVSAFISFLDNFHWSDTHRMPAKVAHICPLTLVTLSKTDSRGAADKWYDILNAIQSQSTALTFEDTLSKHELGKRLAGDIGKAISVFFDDMDTNTLPFGGNAPVGAEDLANDIARDQDQLRLLVPFLVLCCFRRPRLHSSIVAGLAAFWPADWRVSRKSKKAVLGAVIKELRRTRVLVRDADDCGMYWIPRFAHEATYKLLTDSVRLVRIETCLTMLTAQSTPDPQAVLDSYRRLCFLVLAHSTLAAHYYLEVYKRSHSPSALREYLYHRMSAIRYLTLLNRLHVLATQSLSAEVRHKCDTLWAKLRAREGGAVAGTIESHMNTSVQIMVLVRKYLLMFRNVISRERNAFRSTLSTDSWLNWLERVITTDLQICGTAVDPLSYPSAIEKRIDAELRAHAASVEDAKVRVERVLFRLRIDLLREQGSWSKCAAACFAFMILSIKRWQKWIEPLLADSEPLVKSLKAFAAKNVDLDLDDPAVNIEAFTGDVGLLMQSLAGSLGVIVHVLEKNDQPISQDALIFWFDGLFHAILRLLECQVQGRLVARNASPAPDWSWINGARNLVKGLQKALMAPMSQGVPGERAEQGRGKSTKRKKVNATEGQQERGRMHWGFRNQYAAWLGTMDDVILDFEYEESRAQVDEWGLSTEAEFLPQGKENPLAVRRIKAKEVRTLCERFEDMVTRTQGATFARDNDLPSERHVVVRAKVLNQLAWCLGLLGEFKAALLRLDQAECLLRDEETEHRIILAIVHRTRSVLLTRLADECLRRKWFADGKPEATADYAKDVMTRCHKAKRALERSDVELSQAESMLVSATRHVRTWGRLFEQRARLSIDELLVLAVETDFGVCKYEEDWCFRGHVSTIVECGLNAIRGTMACQSGNESIRRKGAATMWFELLTAAQIVLSGFACRTLHGLVGQTKGGVVRSLVQTDQKALRDAFVKLWTFLNLSNGLDEFLSTECGWLKDTVTLGFVGEKTNKDVFEAVVDTNCEYARHFGSRMDGSPEWLLHEVIKHQMASVIQQ